MTDERWYLDASAALKLLVTEAESDALAIAITDRRPDLVACALLETELRRAVMRYDGLNQSDAVALLNGVELFEVPLSLFREAGLVPRKHQRSLDALHLAAAIRLDVDAVVTYDACLPATARDLGIPVESPGNS